MELAINRGIRRLLDRDRSATRVLGDLERMLADGRTPPPARLKRSGEGRKGIVQPYIDLGLWHAKLDSSGKGHGDPMLVFQREADDVLRAVAITTHEHYTSVDPEKCLIWLWENRENIDWTVSPESQAVLQGLEAKFARPKP